jgi:hypothetical protein
MSRRIGSYFYELMIDVVRFVCIMIIGLVSFSIVLLAFMQVMNEKMDKERHSNIINKIYNPDPIEEQKFNMRIDKRI